MLAAVQRKQALAHGVVKCTCKCNDLLFQLRVARLMESKKVSRRDSQHVFEHPTLKPGCVLHTWSHKHRPAPEQIFHEKSNGLKCVEHFFYIFAEFWCSVSTADKILFLWPLQAWKKFLEHSKHCDVRLCIHFVIWLNQKAIPFRSVSTEQVSLSQSGSRTHLLTHAQTQTHQAHLCAFHFSLMREREGEICGPHCWILFVCFMFGFYKRISDFCCSVLMCASVIVFIIVKKICKFRRPLFIWAVDVKFQVMTAVMSCSVTC